MCRFAVYSADGSEIGSVTSEFASLDPEVPRSAPYPVPIDGGTPVTASAECSVAEAPTGNYVVENTSFEPGPEGWVRLVADVRWGDGSPPGAGLCRAVISTDDGSSRVWEFTLQVGEGRKVLGSSPTRYEGATKATVTCEPYLGSA
jgi:hypothetical protein